jgi:peptidoglycan/LPS O-acetylase OafA/YrhL
MTATAVQPAATISWSAKVLAPYRRITSSGVFIPEVDGLRFIALLCVYVYHLAGNVFRHSRADYTATLQNDHVFALTQQLHTGVPLFFVLSGFILGLPFARAALTEARPVSLRAYFWRRLIRLEPPYILCMVAFFLLKIARGSTIAQFAPNLAASLLYVHNIVFGEPSLISVVAWSLEVEVQFYILAPALALLYCIHQQVGRRAVLISLIVLSSGISAHGGDTPLMHLTLAGNLQYFLGGFLLADLYLHRRVPTRPRVWTALALSAWTALFAALVFWPSGVRVFGGVWVPLLYIASYGSPLVRAMLANVWITTLGGMCYSIYLIHNYAIAALGFLTASIGTAYPFSVRLLLQFLLLTPGVIAICALYFRFVERPCMNPNWPEKLLRRYRQWRAVQG